MASYHNYEALLTEAFVNLGFVLTTRRFTLFLKLALAYSKSEMQTITAAEFKGGFQFEQSDRIDMLAVHFIHHHGDQLWPKSGRRKHLNDESSTQGRLAWIREQDQDLGAQDWKLWDEMIRSPLGQAVRKYFGLVANLPAELMDSHQEQEADIPMLKWEMLIA